jgi:PAS domain S-box-containing protein
MVPERIRQGATRPEIAPALFRLLAEAALSRAALDACGAPVALVDAASPSRPLSYVNRAFEGFFGYRAAEALGRTPAALLFPGDVTAETLFVMPDARLQLRASRKDGTHALVDVAVDPLRGSDGRVTHWVLAFCGRSDLEALRAQD